MLVDKNKLLANAKQILKNNWKSTHTVPSQYLYPHQWSWDSAFIAIGYSHYAPKKARSELNSILSTQWEDGRIPHIVFNPKATGHFPTPQSWKTLIKDKDNWLKTGTVPLSILSAEDANKPKQRYIDSTEFDEWLNTYLNQNRHILPEGTTTLKIFQVLNGILNYPFVFYPLSSDRKLPDICNIFARVNAKGMRLSTFDLMNAFLYPKGVELRKNLWEGLDNETLKNIDSNMNEYLLKLISLNKQNYCSSKYIHNLIPNVKAVKKDESGKRYDVVLIKSGKEFIESWDNACKYAERARKIIMNTGTSDFGAIKTDFIPNTTIVPV